MLKKLLRVFIFVCGLIVLCMILVLVLFVLNRDRIESELLRIANEAQAGEITVRDMDLSLFAYFPKVSLRLNDVVYSEHREGERPAEEKPIVRADHVYVGIDVIELIRGKVDVSEVGLKQGEINLFVYPDRTLNLSNALGLSGGQGVEQSGATGPQELQISDLDIEDMVFRLLDTVSSLDVGAHIKDLSADINLRAGVADCRLASDVVVRQVSLQDRERLQEQALKTDLDFRFNTETSVGDITRGVLDFRGVKIDLEGEFDLEPGILLDIELDASGAGSALLPLLLDEQALEQNRDLLRSGDFFLKGSIKGEILGRLPETTLSFGAQDIRINIPGSQGGAIQGFGFSGSFRSGTNPDLSQAQLEIEDLEAVMPGGDLAGTLKISNLREPRVYLDWESRTDLSVLAKVFRLGNIDSMSGIVSISAKIDSDVELDDQIPLKGSGHARVKFDGISAQRRGWEFPVESLNGSIEYAGQQGLSLKDISMRRDHSRLKLSGSVQNLIYGLFDRDREITAHLLLESEGMRIGDLLFFRSLSPGVAALHLQNMALDCSLQAHASVLSGFTNVPPVDIQIHHFQTELEGYPDVKSLTGKGKLFDDGSEGARVPFEELAIELPFGRFDLAGELGFPPGSQPITLNTTLKAEELQLRKLITGREYQEKDPGDEFTPLPQGGLLNATMQVEAGFPQSPLSIGTIRITGGEVVVHKQDDNDIILKGVGALIKDVTLDADTSSGPIKGLSSWGLELGIEHIHTPLIKDLGLSAWGEGREDKWQFDIDTDGLVGDAEEGHFEIHFMEELPVYRLKYEIHGFDVVELQKKLGDEGLLVGKMDILVDLSSSGRGWRELLINTNGQLIQRGEDMLLQSVDLDKILQNFKRSQGFNLADVGAFFLAGPVGVVATKGSDFAQIANITPGDQTHITRFLSHLQINGGIVEARDVAFATTKNRIALKGKADLALMRIENVTAAAVDKKGCSLISQSVSGDFKEPQWGKVNVVGTLLGAVTNVLKLVTGDNCRPFYTGSVPHPIK